MPQRQARQDLHTATGCDPARMTRAWVSFSVADPYLRMLRCILIQCETRSARNRLGLLVCVCTAACVSTPHLCLYTEALIILGRQPGMESLLPSCIQRPSMQMCTCALQVRRHDAGVPELVRTALGIQQNVKLRGARLRCFPLRVQHCFRKVWAEAHPITCAYLKPGQHLGEAGSLLR